MDLIHGGDVAGYEARYGRRPLDFSANVSPLGLPEGVRRAVADMEAAVAEAGSYAGESRAVYNSSDNRSANIVNHNYNGLTAGQVDAIMSRQVERVLYGRR